MKMTTTRKKRAKKKTVTTSHKLVGWSRRGALLLAFTLLASAIPIDSFASDKQLREHYALIVGTVWAPGNRAAFGVRVQLRRSGEKKVLQESVSNHTGEVAFRVPEGKADYTLTADVKPSKGKTKPEVTAHVEKDERVEVSLHLTE